MMSRIEKKASSLCTDLPLNNAEVCQKLQLLKNLLRSCYGPTGRLKQVHNNIGGHVITTSTSSVLLPALTSSKPLLNLIKTSLLNHVNRLNDCGLFAGILCLSLLEQAKHYNLRESVTIIVNQHLLGVCTEYLQRDDCPCRVKIDFCSSQNLITLARSVISSKPTCLLKEKEKVHLSVMAVRAFLQTIPRSSPGPVILGEIVMHTVESHSVLDSDVFPGLLIDVPEWFDCSLSTPPLRMVLFSTSLAGDIPDLGDGTIEVDADLDLDGQVLDQLLKLGKQLVDDEVRLCICQKVIHPILQDYLRSHGIVVVERLGIFLMEPLITLTGAQPVSTLHAKIPSKAYGVVKDLSIRQLGSKTLLHLHQAGESAVCTMVLCHRNETMLDELKVVCQKAKHVLRLTLKEPSALLGGGCTETILAAYLRHKCKLNVPETASTLGCSQTEFLLGLKGFCRSLEHVARSLEHDGGMSIIDLTHAHHWTVAAHAGTADMEHELGFCGCGLVKIQPSSQWTYLDTEYTEFAPDPVVESTSVKPSVLDSFAAKINALQVAVETANLVLDVKYIIQDMN